MLFLKQPLLPFFCHKSATTCQIDSNKVANPKLKPDLCNCVKSEMINSTAPPQQPHKRGTIILGHPVNSRRSKFRLKLQFRKSSAGQKCLSYMRPKIWNSLSSDLKSTNSINSFKHKIKDNFFQNIQREEKDVYVFY